MPGIDLSVIIPVYRSAATLEVLVGRLRPVLEQLALAYEIILVDDGSPDGSWPIIQQLHKAYPNHVVAIQLMRNFGQHNALMCGFRHARGHVAVTMDDDLQNPPEEIPRLLKALRSREWDVVYGCYQTKKHQPWRNLGSAFVSWFYRRVFKIPVTISSFRIIRRPVLESIFSYALNYTFIDGLLAWSTQRIGQVPVEHHPRRQGRSGYSLNKLVLLALNLFTNFSLIPLQIISACGVVAASVGLLGSLYYLVQYLLANITVPGYGSTIVAVLTLGGIQLMALGIMGEYLGRLHLNMNCKPQYVERQVLGPAAADTSAGADHSPAPGEVRREAA